MTPTGSTGLGALATVLRSPVVLAGPFAILLVLSGHFGGFPYIRPAVESMSDIGDGGGLALLLLVFGIASFVGTLLAGHLADSAPRMGSLLFPTVLAAGMDSLVATFGAL